MAFSMERLGKAIERRRVALRLTPYALAKLAGVSNQYVATLEAGSGKRVGVEIVAAIASALGVTLDELLTDAGLPNGPKRTEADLDGVYRELNPINRRALVDIGHILRETQTEYQAWAEAESDTIAAFSEEDLAQEDRRESEDFNGA